MSHLLTTPWMEPIVYSTLIPSSSSSYEHRPKVVQVIGQSFDVVVPTNHNTDHTTTTIKNMMIQQVPNVIHISDGTTSMIAILSNHVKQQLLLQQQQQSDMLLLSTTTTTNSRSNNSSSNSSSHPILSLQGWIIRIHGWNVMVVPNQHLQDDQQHHNHTETTLNPYSTNNELYQTYAMIHSSSYQKKSSLLPSNHMDTITTNSSTLPSSSSTTSTDTTTNHPTNNPKQPLQQKIHSIYIQINEMISVIGKSTTTIPTIVSSLSTTNYNNINNHHHVIPILDTIDIRRAILEIESGRIHIPIIPTTNNDDHHESISSSLPQETNHQDNHNHNTRHPANHVSLLSNHRIPMNHHSNTIKSPRYHSSVRTRNNNNTKPTNDTTMIQHHSNQNHIPIGKIDILFPNIGNPNNDTSVENLLILQEICKIDTSLFWNITSISESNHDTTRMKQPLTSDHTTTVVAPSSSSYTSNDIPTNKDSMIVSKTIHKQRQQQQQQPLEPKQNQTFHSNSIINTVLDNPIIMNKYTKNSNSTDVFHTAQAMIEMSSLSSTHSKNKNNTVIECLPSQKNTMDDEYITAETMIHFSNHQNHHHHGTTSKSTVIALQPQHHVYNEDDDDNDVIIYSPHREVNNNINDNNNNVCNSLEEQDIGISNMLVEEDHAEDNACDHHNMIGSETNHTTTMSLPALRITNEIIMKDSSNTSSSLNVSTSVTGNADMVLLPTMTDQNISNNTSTRAITNHSNNGNSDDDIEMICIQTPVVHSNITQDLPIQEESDIKNDKVKAEISHPDSRHNYPINNDVSEQEQHQGDTIDETNGMEIYDNPNLETQACTSTIALDYNNILDTAIESQLGEDTKNAVPINGIPLEEISDTIVDRDQPIFLNTDIGNATNAVETTSTDQDQSVSHRANTNTDVDMEIENKDITNYLLETQQYDFETATNMLPRDESSNNVILTTSTNVIDDRKENIGLPSINAPISNCEMNGESSDNEIFGFMNQLETQQSQYSIAARKSDDNENNNNNIANNNDDVIVAAELQYSSKTIVAQRPIKRARKEFQFGGDLLRSFLTNPI